MDADKTLDQPIKKRSSLNTELLTLRVSRQIKAMEKELKEMQWDTAEVARIAIKSAFEKALKLEQSNGS